MIANDPPAPAPATVASHVSARLAAAFLARSHRQAIARAREIDAAAASNTPKPDPTGGLDPAYYQYPTPEALAEATGAAPAANAGAEISAGAVLHGRLK